MIIAAGSEPMSRQRMRWLLRHPRGQQEVRGGRYVPKADKDDRRVLRKWIRGGVEYAFHATKGLRKRRVNS